MATARLKPRKTPKQARARNTQGRIIEAAARVFAEWGYSAGTTNRIAEEAGMSVGSLYQYFPNKDAILVTLVRQHVDEGARAVADLLDRSDSVDALDDLVGMFVDAVIANHDGDPRLHQVLFQEAPRPPELLSELHNLEESLVTAVVSLLGAQPSVRRPHPRMAAWMAVAAVESLTHRYFSSQVDTQDLRSFRDELVSLVVSYLTAPADRRP